jgi:hypothetical protein
LRPRAGERSPGRRRAGQRHCDGRGAVGPTQVRPRGGRESKNR